MTNSKRSPMRKAWLWFFLVGSLLAGAGFVYKMHEFFWDLSGTEGFEFAGAHLVTYLLVAGGFLLLLVHGFLSGHWSDIERPKHELLAREMERDEREYGPDFPETPAGSPS